MDQCKRKTSRLKVKMSLMGEGPPAPGGTALTDGSAAMQQWPVKYIAREL